ncbi:MAG TPA: multicopper oxidase domain-containing protein [Sedimentisphaerales bacterium]|nr:multicopper oxidase domain-containing protein [Sedimentisphaerales bacterium]
MKYYEIPIAIQDRIFTRNGQLFFPDNRAFFEGLFPSQLQIPFYPDINPLNMLMSDVSPLWNPEFFGNTMVVNGRTWPYLNVEPRRYRFRLLNGCNARFLMLKMDNPAISFWQIGSEGGFLPAPVNLSELLIGPAERADIIIDFTGLAPGTEVVLQNIGPDEPFGGGTPGIDFAPADPNTTGQVMKFVVVAAGTGSLPDTSTAPAALVLPAFTPLGDPSVTRQVSLNEAESATVNVIVDANGNIVVSEDPFAVPFGPAQALLGTVNPDGSGNPLAWMDAITENPQLNDTEIWEIHNFTMDAHPIHLHLVMFQVVDRTPIGDVIGGPATRAPETWETGYKDTVIAYPGEITRVKARFDIAGLYVWHCHIIDHEDNEMMRPYQVVQTATAPGAPTDVTAVAGDAQATVSFTAPVSDGGSAITLYTVTSNPEGITASGPESPITVTGLTNGTAYTFTVTATNAIGTGPASAPSNSVTPSSLVEVIVDNRSANTLSVGTWQVSGASGYWGIDSVWSRTYRGRFTFFADLVPGTYEVYEWHTVWPSRVTNARHRISNNFTSLDTVYVNQKVNGSQWNLLGTYTFDGTASVTIYARTGDSNSTNADAVKLVRVP